MTLCDAVLETMFGGAVVVERCESDATWEGENEDGQRCFACDDHRDLTAPFTLTPVPPLAAKGAP